MRVLVYAGRDYKDRDKVFEVLDGLHRAHAAPIGDHKPGARRGVPRWAWYGAHGAPSPRCQHQGG